MKLFGRDYSVFVVNKVPVTGENIPFVCRRRCEYLLEIFSFWTVEKRWEKNVQISDENLPFRFRYLLEIFSTWTVEKRCAKKMQILMRAFV